MSDENNNNNNEVVVRQPSAAIQTATHLAEDIRLLAGEMVTQQDAMLLGSMYQSGYFKSVDSLSKAVTRVVFGKQLGLSVGVSLTSLYIIDGKPALEAAAIRNQVIVAGYGIKTLEFSNERVEQEWSLKGEVLGTVEYTKQDAVMAGFIDPTCTEWPLEHNNRSMQKYNKWKKLYETVEGCECKDNWRKVPKEMLQARCTTRGQRMYGNGAFNNQQVYDVDEIIESNLGSDRTATELARSKVNACTSLDELDIVVNAFSSTELEACADIISTKTQELISSQEQA